MTNVLCETKGHKAKSSWLLLVSIREVGGEKKLQALAARRNSNFVLDTKACN